MIPNTLLRDVIFKLINIMESFRAEEQHDSKIALKAICKVSKDKASRKQNL